MLDCSIFKIFILSEKIITFPGGGSATDVIDCLIISHFHLDHCGSLPYFTEKFGYNGPLLMTAPTRAIAPLLLEVT